MSLSPLLQHFTGHWCCVTQVTTLIPGARDTPSFCLSLQEAAGQWGRPEGWSLCLPAAGGLFLSLNQARVLSRNPHQHLCTTARFPKTVGLLLLSELLMLEEVTKGWLWQGQWYSDGAKGLGRTPGVFQTCTVIQPMFLIPILWSLALLL